MASASHDHDPCLGGNVAQDSNGTGPIPPEQAAAEVTRDAARGPGPVLTPPITKAPGVGKSGFFDPTHPDASYHVVLQRLIENGREIFKLEQPIGYWDHLVGAVIVPADLGLFRTDLTSVPRYFTWLVPTTGLHLPAALVHDGLVHDPLEPQTYIADKLIDRATADRIFRDGMRHLNASWVQRWLVWTAVATATIFKEPLRRTWWSRIAVALTVLVIVGLGTAATIDLIDCRAPLPWMADRPGWLEVVYGGIAAVIIPALLSLLWWPRYQAGLIGGIALALLLHVTVAIAIVFAVYSAADAFGERQIIRGLRSAGLAAVLIGAIVLIGVWVC